MLLKTTQNHLRLQWVIFLYLTETLHQRSGCSVVGVVIAAGWIILLQIRQVFRMSHQIILLLTVCWKHFTHSRTSFRAQVCAVPTDSVL